MSVHNKTYMSKDELRRYLSQLESQTLSHFQSTKPKQSDSTLFRKKSLKLLRPKQTSTELSSPVRRFGNARNANTDYRLNDQHEKNNVTYESLAEKMGLQFINSSSRTHSRARSAPGSQGRSSSNTATVTSQIEDDYFDDLQPTQSPVPMPLIHFPRDHPFYQGEPLNAIHSDLDPRLSLNRDFCAHCHQSLAGTKTLLKAIGNSYHPQCFQCARCGISLEHAEFYPHENRIYCHHDYHELFSPRCDYCHMPIEEEVISAAGRTYHAGHFFCVGCSKAFSATETFHIRGEHAWCHDCFMSRFATQCWRCQKQISEGEVIIKAIGRDWCSTCFSCEECATPFGDDGFVIRHDGTLVCIECEKA
ncbi:hypothetical protein V1512DRAFT_266036 [Lipomyces arxii]|uniref:uncharacterized protein n=1 Tax=Lipomyces arxii TaxID=56418 RepID=UPI0034CFD5A8